MARRSMDPLGHVTVIKRSGNDGYRYPLRRSACWFGRDSECDIRLQMPVVPKQQCKIEFRAQLEAVLINLNSANPTQLNGTAVSHPVKLEQGDLITISDRSFRFEYENGLQNEGKPRRPSEPRSKEVTPTQSQSTSILDSEQYRDIPTKYTEENIRQLSQIHTLEDKGNANKSKKDDDVEEHLIQKVPTLKTKELKERATNIIEKDVCSKSGDSDGIGGDVSLFSTLEHSGKSGKCHFSPFRKLFGLMKEELSCKSQQTGDRHPRNRKSGPATLVSVDGKEWETELLHLPGSRPLHRSKTLMCMTVPGAEQGEEGGAFQERCLEDPFKYPVEDGNEKVVGAQERNLQSLNNLQKWRKSEELPAENARKRKSKSLKEDKRRSAPAGPLSEAWGQQSLYMLRSQTKTPEKCSSLEREASEPQQSKAMPAEKSVLKESHSNRAAESVDLPQNKGSSKGNGNRLTPKKAFKSEQTLKKVQDELDFKDNVSETDGSSVKRRRVSFGVHLRPELFDENLPPNTPLKKGESPGTRRTSFGNCPPRAVLKKTVIKQEHSKLPGKEPSSDSGMEGMLHVQDLSLELPTSPKKISATDSDDISESHFLDETAERVPVEIQPQKMVTTPSYSRRSSRRRSQHDTLQRIYAKRRSGASEANLMVVHSWADVVRLGTRKPQANVVVKHGPERRMIKKQKRLTPKKPVSQAQNHFSTGHANSPSTIVIGRAHTEKVTAPVRPCRMLNNFVLNLNMDMNEDLTGLADMFETPKKNQSPDLQILSEQSCSSGPTSGDFERVMTPTILDTARQTSGQSITCRRSPRNRKSWGGDDEISIKTLWDTSEIRSDEIMKIPLPDVDVEPKILTLSSKRLKTYTPKENVPTPYLNRTETPEAQTEEGVTPTQKINFGERITEQSITREEYHSEMATPHSRMSILEDVCVKGATEIPSNTVEQPEENAVDVHIGLMRNPKPEVSEGSLGATASLKSGSKKEQEMQTHRRTSLRSEERPPAGARGAEKVVTSPRGRIEAGEGLTGNREIRTTPAPVAAAPKEDAENKVAESAGDEENVQKNLRTTPKQVVYSAGNAKVQKKLMRTVKQQIEVEDVASIEQLMDTPTRTCQPAELTEVKRLMRTPKDKVEPGEDVAGSEKLVRTHEEKEPVESHKSNRSVNVRQTPKQKFHQSTEDLVDFSRLMHATKEKRREPLEDFTDLEPMTTPKQVVEPVKGKKVNKAIMKQSTQKYESEDLTGIRGLRTPKEKEELMEDGKVVENSVKTLEQECGDPVVECLAVDIEKIKTSKVASMEDMTDDLEKLKRKPKEEIKPVETMKPGENLTDFRKIIKRTPEEKIKSTETLTGFRTHLKSPKVKPAEDLTGIKRLMKTPKQKGEQPVEDLTGIQRLMKTPKRKGEQPVEDLTGIQRLMRSPKVKGVEQPEEYLTSIRRLMATPKQKAPELVDLTGIQILMKTPKEKGEPVENLTDVTVFMETADEVAENMYLTNCVIQSNPQEISDIDSEFSEKLQEIEVLRRPAIKAFSFSNFEAQSKSREYSSEIDYTGFKEMFELPEESKDQTVDQCQQKICSSPCEEDENKFNTSKINGLCSVNLEDNIVDQGILSLFTPRNRISQAVHKHEDLPSETENISTEKKAKKSLLSFQDEIRDKSNNQRTISLRSRSKNKSDTESLDGKIVKTSSKQSMKEVVEHQARLGTPQSIGRSCKTGKGLQEGSNLSPSEKEEKKDCVKSGPRTLWDTADSTESIMEPLRPRRRNQADKDTKTSSSDVSDRESSEGKSVKNFKERLDIAGVAMTLRSRNKNREQASESDVSHTDDDKKLRKRLPKKASEISTQRFSRRNKINKELQESSPLLSERDVLAREKNEKKGIMIMKSRTKAETKLGESTSLARDTESPSHTEGCEEKPVEVLKEKPLKKRIVNNGMNQASRPRTKKKEIFLSESDDSSRNDEKESVESSPDLKEQKVLLDSSKRNTFEELNSLSSETNESHTDNDEKYVKNHQRKTVSVNKDGVALRSRNRNKTSTDTTCIENKEQKPTRSLQTRWETIVHEKVRSLRSGNRSKCAQESQGPNDFLAKAPHKPETVNDEKKSVNFQEFKDECPNKGMEASRPRSKNKVDKEYQLSRETDRLSESFPGKLMSLRSRSKNKIGPETQVILCPYVENSEKKPLEKKLKENIANKASLQSGSRSRGNRLLHPSSGAPEELYLKDEKKTVKVQKNLDDTTGNGEIGMSLRSRSKNKMDTGLNGSNPVPTSKSYRGKDAKKSMSTFPGISKNSAVLDKILPLTRNRRNKADRLYCVSATEIVTVEEKKLSSLENKAEDKVQESLRTGSRNEVDGELHSFPLLTVNEIAYTEKNQEKTGKILQDEIVTENLVSLKRSRRRNQNDSELIGSNSLLKTEDISPLGKEGKENIVCVLNKTGGGIISQASRIGTRLRNKSDTDQQRSTNLGKDNPPTAASRTPGVAAGGEATAEKAKKQKQVVKRGRLRTAGIKLSEPTVVENSCNPENLPKSAPGQDKAFKVIFLSTEETQSEPLLREGSSLLNNTNQAGENDALSGNEIWSKRLSNNQEEPDSQQKGTLGSRRKYTLRETKPSTRSSKQNNSNQTAKKNIKV